LDFRLKKSNSASDRHRDVISSPKIAKPVGKCAAHGQTRDLFVRITSNFGKMISHIAFVGF